MTHMTDREKLMASQLISCNTQIMGAIQIIDREKGKAGAILGGTVELIRKNMDECARDPDFKQDFNELLQEQAKHQESLAKQALMGDSDTSYFQ